MKEVIIRTVFLVLCLILVYQAVWWLLVPVALVYAIWFDAYELILVAFCLDVYLAPALVFPYYAAAATLVLLIGMIVRPWLYTHTALERLS